MEVVLTKIAKARELLSKSIQFKIEGTARKLLKINNKWQDHTVFSYLYEDYKNLK